MSPRPADPELRTALIEAAARLISKHGTDGLSLRHLASEVGTSTMAIYTHFGGMKELHAAVRREGFDRLAQHLSAVEETGDAVADLSLLGVAYTANAQTNPNLYRAMFMERPADEADAAVGSETFDQLLRAVERCVEARRFTQVTADELALQLWALAHGLIALHLAGMLTEADVFAGLAAGARNLFKAAGDDPRALGRSMATSGRRLAEVRSS